MRPRPLLLAALALGALAAAEARAQSDPTSARITVKLPREARLYVDGVACPVRSDNLVFDTPRLESGVKFAYTLRVELADAGRTLSLSKRVTFRAGGAADADFGDRMAFIAAARQGDPGWKPPPPAAVTPKQ